MIRLALVLDKAMVSKVLFVGCAVQFHYIAQ